MIKPGKNVWLLLVGTAFFVIAGFSVRYAEDMQVGYTHDTSMWMFVIAGLFAYAAAIVAFMQFRRRKK